MKVGDYIYIKSLDEYGIIKEIKNDRVKVTLDNGKVTYTVKELIIIIQAASNLWISIKNLFNRIFRTPISYKDED